MQIMLFFSLRLRNAFVFYQWTAIDECTRYRFVYAFEEHTPENTVKFLKMLLKEFPFRIQAIQTDNGTEFTYKFISDTEISPLDKMLQMLKIPHILIPPRTPWHNGKVERSHRNDQRYFYDWETFRTLDELNEKLIKHLEWSNHKTMRTLGRKSPQQLLAEKLVVWADRRFHLPFHFAYGSVPRQMKTLYHVASSFLRKMVHITLQRRPTFEKEQKNCWQNDFGLVQYFLRFFRWKVICGCAGIGRQASLRC